MPPSDVLAKRKFLKRLGVHVPARPYQKSMIQRTSVLHRSQIFKDLLAMHGAMPAAGAQTARSSHAADARVVLQARAGAAAAPTLRPGETLVTPAELALGSRADRPHAH